MTAPIFSETGESALPESPLQDSRTDINAWFVHSQLDDYGLTPPQFRVYAHIARRASSGKAWPAVATIARICLLHPQTVRQALRVLVRQQFITRQLRPGRTPIYRLTPASQWQPPTEITDNPSESDTPPSVSDATTTKRIQDYPYERNGDEGNPIEGNPTKEKTHIPRQGGLPRSEAEAVEQAKLAGVPPEFAISEFNRMEGVGWIDGCQRQVRSWRHYLAQRWSKEQSERQERKTRSQARAGRTDVLPNGETIPMRRYKLEKQIEEQTREVDYLYKSGQDYRAAKKEVQELYDELDTLGQKPPAIA